MKKNKIVSLLSTVAVIAIVQAFAGVSASAAIIDGNYSNIKFEVLGGGFSYAPYQLSVNPSGEYCTRDASGLTLQLKNIKDYNAIKSVNFEVTSQGSQSIPIYTKTISGDIVGEECGEQFRFSWLPLRDNYTVKVYANDNYGNTYTWTKHVKRDRSAPTIDGLGIWSKGSAYTAPDGNLIVNNDAIIQFTVNDVNPFYSSWIKEVSLKVYDSTQAQPIKDVIVTPNNPSYKNIGTCVVDLELLKYGNTSKKFIAYITATDYAGNETTESKVFYYQR